MPRPRSPARAFESLVRDAARPVLLLDEQRRVLYVNEALRTWLGVSDEAELLGLVLNYQTPAAGPLAGCNLAPPPECFAGEAIRMLVSKPCEGSETSRRWAHCLPLGDAPAAVLVLLETGEAEEEEAEEPDSPAELHRRLAELVARYAWGGRLEALLGESPAIQLARQQAEAAIAARARVVVTGPPASGREATARAIHLGRGEPPSGPIAPLECPLLDAERLQAIVMAFLRRLRAGENPHGSLLLLEADRLEAGAQQELAGLLALPNLHLRTLATSEQSLLKLAEEGRFRRDLAAQLEVIRIALPPLAERIDDLPQLAQAVLEQENRGERQFTGFGPATLDRLALYAWPGNLRQLRDVIREAARRARGTVIQVADLPPLLEHAAGAAAAAGAGEPEEIELDAVLLEVQRELITRALARTGGNKAAAARALGISRPRLIRLVEDLKIEAGETPEE